MNEYNPADKVSRGTLALALVQTLDKAGFMEEPSAQQGEKIFFRAVSESIRVVVYTTIDGMTVRGDGKDAIRVCGLYKTREGHNKGIVSVKRVNRVGTIESIQERMLERMREVWRCASQPDVCRKCGAPLFISKNNNKVCAEVCWTKEQK